jgi:monovalent cation/proton antiporter MnhG/PhaG subunit
VANVAVDVLLGIGVVLEIACCIGLLVMRTSFDRLHYASAGVTVPAFCILAAVLVREHVSAGGLEAIAAVMLLFLLYPVLLTATARAARRVDYDGEVGASSEEKKLAKR